MSELEADTPAVVGTQTPGYYVRTWDCELGEWTPQVGVPEGPYSLWGLRRALRELKEIGYECGRRDPSVLVEKVGP